MTTVGKVCDLTTTFNFEWKIDNFLSLPEEADKYFNSPKFNFAGEDWELTIYPNGESEDDAVGYIGVYLFRKLSGTPISLAWSLSIKTVTGKRGYKRKYSRVFEEDDGRGSPKFLKRSILSEKKSELMACDALTIVCTIEYCSRVNEDADHKQKCLDKSIQCSTCKEEVTLRNWSDHECETWRIREFEELSENLKDLSTNKDSCDVVLKVQNKEFKAHKFILIARSSVFASFFQHDTLEKRTGIVKITDCDPQSFQEFLDYLYSGQLEEISYSSAFQLYITSNKYNVHKLKEHCIRYLIESLTVENVCEIVILADKFSESDLLFAAQKFFTENWRKIFLTTEWKNLLKNDYRLVDKLLVELSKTKESQ